MSSIQRIQATASPDLTITVKTDTTISLVWTTVYDAEEYHLYRGTTQVYAGTALSFVDTGLTPNTQYTYVIRSFKTRALESFGSTATGVTLPGVVVSQRLWAPGWYTALSPQQSAAGIPNSASGVRSATGPVTDQTAGIVVRMNLSAINSTGTTYLASGTTLINQWLSDLAKFNNLTQPNVRLFIMLIGRTFNGSISGTFTANIAGQSTATLDSTSSGLIANGAYGVGFQDIGGSAGSPIVSRTDVTVSGTASVRNVSWLGVLPTGASITAGAFNLLSNSPMPADIAGFAEPFLAGTGGTPGGWQAWWWSQTVVTRMDAIIRHLNTTFENHPNWGGIATQETSTGGAVGGNGTDAYTATRFSNAIMAFSDSISSSAFSRHMCYCNALRGDTTGALLTGIFDHVQSNGAIVGPPDWPTQRAGALSIYKYMNDYLLGINGITGTGPCMIVAQSGEFTGTGGVADPNPVSFEDLYNYATQSNTYTTNNALDHRPTATIVANRSKINCSVAVIDYHTNATPPAGTGVFADFVPIMAAHPLLGNPWSPS